MKKQTKKGRETIADVRRINQTDVTYVVAERNRSPTSLIKVFEQRCI